MNSRMLGRTGLEVAGYRHSPYLVLLFDEVQSFAKPGVTAALVGLLPVSSSLVNFGVFRPWHMPQ